MATGAKKAQELTPRAQFVERWEHYTLWPLVILGLVFLALYAVPIIWPELPAFEILDIDITMDVIWALFIIDFLVKFVVVEKKWPFIKAHVIDIIALALPFFRPLRALRVVGVATLALRKFGAKVRHRVLVYVGVLALFVWFIAGLAVTQAERGVPGSNIHGVADGWWWSFMTMATVGFGDRFPVGAEGRLIGVLVVLSGLALLGTLTAAIATWFINTSRREEDEIIEAGERRMLRELTSLRRELAELRELIGEKPAAKPVAKPAAKTTRGSSRRTQQ